MAWVVAKIDFFHNELTQELFELDGTIDEAYVAQATADFGNAIAEAELETVDEIQQFYFDCDCAINIIKI